MATLPSATRSWTIRQLLWLQVAGAVALLFLVGTVLAINYAAAERRVIEAQRVHVAANLTHLVDRELANIIAALQALAASPAAQSQDFEALRSQAAAAAWLRSLSDIAIVELSGTQLFSSAVPTGQPVPSRPDMGALLPAFEGKIVVSDYAIGVSTQSPIFFVTVPVLRDAGISYVLSAGIKLDRLNGIFAEAGLPADWVSAIVDRNGIFLARSIGADLFVGRPARPEIVSVARSGAPSGLFENTTLEGVPVANSYRRSSLSAWTSVVAVPTAILNAPLRRLFLLLALGILTSLVISLGLASFVAHRIVEPVSSLSAAAEALAIGKPPIPHRIEIEELKKVWEAFQRTHTIVEERARFLEELAQKAEAEHRLNQELERTVAELRETEGRYRAAMAVGRMGSWVTDLETGTRLWTDEAMALFGLNLPGGRGHVGGGTDEYLHALHPEDRHLMAEFHRLADQQDTFEAEYRILRSDGVIWLAGRGRVVSRSADGKARRMISIVSDITERKAAEEKVKFLMRELAHRSKNLIAVIQAIAAQTARSARTQAEFQQNFGQRLQAIAASQDLLVRGEWSGASLRELIGQHLAPFSSKHGQLELDGPDLALSPEAAQSIGLALHELATNAAKYGALSVPSGKLRVSWKIETGEGQRYITLNWQERGGPRVAPPTKRGFGHVVTGPMVESGVNGSVDLDFAPEGLTWTLRFPEKHLVQT